MKVLPLILTLLVILSIALREELLHYRTTKEGRISTYDQLTHFREKRWATVEEKEAKKEGNNQQSPAAAQAVKVETGKGLPRELNIYPLIDPNLFGQSPEHSQFLLKTVEKLITKQFDESPLYKILLENDPQLVSHLFEAIRDKFSTLEFNVGEKWDGKTYL